MVLYADSVAVFANNCDGAVLRHADEVFKTNSFQYHKTQEFAEPVQVLQHDIEQVLRFKYLGCLRNSGLSVKAEHSIRSASAPHLVQPVPG